MKMLRVLLCTTVILITSLLSNFASSVCERPLAKDEKVHLSARALGQMSLLYADYCKRHGRTESADLARAVYGLSQIAQAASLQHVLQRESLERIASPSGDNINCDRPMNMLSGLRILKAACVGYHGVRKSTPFGESGCSDRKWWSFVLATLCLITKGVERWTEKQSVVRYGTIDDSSWLLTGRTQHLFEGLANFLDYLEFHSHIFAFSELRARENPSLILLKGKRVEHRGAFCASCAEQTDEKNGSQRSAQQLYHYCNNKQVACVYHEECLRSALAKGRTMCTMCGTYFDWDIKKDATTLGVNTLAVLAIPFFLL